MRVLIFIFTFFTFCSAVSGQIVEILLQGNSADSSFYDAEMISANEFWIGGEYGILKKIDSSGNVSSISYPNEGLRILKIQKVKNYIFLATDNGVVYRYDISAGTFYRKQFSGFENKCFYDLIVLDDGNLLLCGGARGISFGEKRVPRGFIAKVDQDLKEIKIVWKSYRKFVWSLLQNEDGDVLAAAFTGLHTVVIKSSDLKLWKKEDKVKGLVHELTSVDSQIWYCGSKGINYSKKGILGTLHEKRGSVLKKTGCLWAFHDAGPTLISVTQSGDLLKIDKSSRKVETVQLPKDFTIYEIIQLSGNRLLVAGHGRLIYLVDLGKLPYQ